MTVSRPRGAPESSESPRSFGSHGALTSPAVPAHPHAPAPVAPTRTAYDGLPPLDEPSASGVAAMVAAGLGMIFVCVPTTYLVGAVLLPLGFVLGVVSLLTRRRNRTFAVAGLLASIVGSVLAALVFLPLHMNSGVAEINDFGQDESVTPIVAEEMQVVEHSEPGASPSNPLPLDSVIESENWSVAINSVHTDASELVTAASERNDEPPLGYRFIMPNLTATYLGPDVGRGYEVEVRYMTESGDIVRSTDVSALAPDAFPIGAPLSAGESITGNVALAVPADTVTEGVLVLTLGLLGMDVFVSMS